MSYEPDEWPATAIDHIESELGKLESRVGCIVSYLNRRVVVVPEPYGVYHCSGWWRAEDAQYAGLLGTVTHLHDDLEQVYVKFDDGRTVRLFVSNLEITREAGQ